MLEPHSFPVFAGDEFNGEMQEVPEKALLRAIVERAVLDFIGPANTPLHLKRSAKLFFRSKRTSPFSFTWICQHLSSDPDGYKERMLRNIERVRGLQKDCRLADDDCSRSKTVSDCAFEIPLQEKAESSTHRLRRSEAPT